MAHLGRSMADTAFTIWRAKRDYGRAGDNSVRSCRHRAGLSLTTRSKRDDSRSIHYRYSSVSPLPDAATATKRACRCQADGDPTAGSPRGRHTSRVETRESTTPSARCPEQSPGARASRLVVPMRNRTPGSHDTPAGEGDQPADPRPAPAALPALNAVEIWLAPRCDHA